MTQQTATAREPDLTIREAATVLAMSEFTMRGKAAAGEFPNAYKVGTRWRISLADINAYRERNRVIERQTLTPRTTRSDAARRAAATRRRSA